MYRKNNIVITTLQIIFSSLFIFSLKVSNILKHIFLHIYIHTNIYIAYNEAKHLKNNDFNMA